MTGLKVHSVRIVIFFLFVLVGVFALMQTHLTQAQPARIDPTLKTIANIVVHPHHQPAQLNKGS
jgi:hypothetical protein